MAVVGWIWIESNKVVQKHYKISNVSDIRDIGIRKGDTLHLKGVGSFRVKRVYAGTSAFTMSVE